MLTTIQPRRIATYSRPHTLPHTHSSPQKPSADLNPNIEACRSIHRFHDSKVRLLRSRLIRLAFFISYLVVPRRGRELLHSLLAAGGEEVMERFCVCSF